MWLDVAIRFLWMLLGCVVMYALATIAVRVAVIEGMIAP